MPQKVLKFTGINRRVNEFQAAGACEELINIRPTVTGAQVMKNKKVLNSEANGYKSIVEHNFGSTSNLIALTESDVMWVRKDGTIVQTVLSNVTAISVATAGNVIVVVMSDKEQKSFRFLDGKYEEYATEIPSVKISVELGSFNAEGFATCEENTMDAVSDALSKSVSQFYRNHPHGLAGPIVVGCTFELEDGNEIWSSGFSIIDPTKDNRYKIAKNGTTDVIMYGAHTATLKFDISNYSRISGVKNIKFYSSIPAVPYEVVDIEISQLPTQTSASQIEGENAGVEPTADAGTGLRYYVSKVSNSEINLAGKTMYLQKVMSFRKSGEFKLNTSSDIAAKELMPVTAGAISRSGDVISYNNRFHYYDADVMHTLQNPSYGVHSNRELPEESNYVEIRTAKLYVVLDDGNDKLFVVDPNSFQVQIASTMDFVYPLGGIKEGYLRTYKDDGSSSWYKIDFYDSEAYNYSCALDYVISTTCDEPDMAGSRGVIEAHAQSVFLREETNAINVSAPYNPFVFPVEHSYSFGGKILDVVTSYLPISSTQIGQYPLTVFTDNGIFALEQGDNNVLYGNIIPLQPMVISGQAKATPHGIFFFSSKNLYVLVGRDVADVSNVLKGKRELGLRDLSTYKTIAHAFIGGVNALSVMDFEEYAEGAVLAYDQLNNELYISNPSLPQNIFYSYVFNLDTKAFHKSNKYYIQDKNSYRYALQQDANRSLVDMNSEEEVTQRIFLQSRPFSLEAFYTHIQRLIMQIDANITGDQKLGLFVFASDNLHDWKCIISAQKKETVLRHIRTNRAAKSYKDYVIILSGTVSTDTDLSDLIADYTVVSRRLG